jgi:hypothetical protein
MDLGGQILRASAVGPGAARALFRTIASHFTDVKETANRILEINQQNMVEANNEARRQSRAASRYMIVTLVAGFRRRDRRHLPICSPVPLFSPCKA